MPISDKMIKLLCTQFVCCAVFLCGCDQSNVMSSEWVKSVPGIYEGVFAGYVEKMTFKTDGVYLHEVSKDGKILFSDRGKWSVPKQSEHVLLEADEYFIEIYDPMYRKINKSERKNVNYVYFPVFLENSFNRISPAMDYEYTLVRTLRDHP